MRAVIYKKRGETPLAALTRFKASHPELSDLPACYAGRLDPMAEGKQLLLFGDECKKREKYQGLDKEYVVEVLLDVASDTGDVLGIARAASKETHPIADTVRTALRQEIGTQQLPYPVFSSKTVGGKPLFLYALEGMLGSIEIPAHEETIYRVSLMDARTIDSAELRSSIEGLLALAPTSDEPSKALGADFRIKDVRESWDAVFNAPSRTYTILTIRIACGTGTYMRTLAERIGAHLGTSALALSITRTRIGTYHRLLRLWREIDNSRFSGI